MGELKTLLPVEYRLDIEEERRGTPCRSRRTRILLRVAFLNFLVVCAILQYVWGNIFAVSDTEEIGVLKFTPCGSIQCTIFETPLDYSDPEGDKVHLAVYRHPASNTKERLGTLLMNPGGPGGSGVDLIAAIGPAVDTILGGKYDLVGWDPRGMVRSTPRLSCFPSVTEEGIFTAGSVVEVATEWRNLSEPNDLAAWTLNLREVEAKNKALSELCFRRSEKIMKYMGTVHGARDLDALSRALEGDETLVNYWGFSYGSVIGSYFVNMFPHRVGRIILDGVPDPILWSSVPSQKWNRVLYADTEKTFESFVTNCVEVGPERCALASKGTDAGSLMATLDDILLTLYESPLPVPDAVRPGVLTSGMVKHLTYGMMRIPRLWPVLAEALNSAADGNGTTIVNMLQPAINLNNALPELHPPTFSGIVCADSPAFEPAEEAFDFIVKESVHLTEHVTRHFGADGTGLAANMCPFWDASSPERFTGPWDHELENEILILGNTADPITPILGARAVNERMANSSRLVVQEGDGHCSLSLSSLCTIKTVRQYLTEGVLPENGRVCEVEELSFPYLDGNPYDLGHQNVSVHDLELLNAMREVGTKFYQVV